MNIAVVFLLLKCGESHGTTVDNEVGQVGEVDGVVGKIEVIASGSEFGDFQISNMSDRVAGGRGIVHSAADHSDSLNDLIVREEVVPVQVRDGEDRLIIREDVSVTVGLFLLSRCDRDRARIHFKITRNVGDVVITLQESISSSRSSHYRTLDIDLIRISCDIRSGRCVHPIGGDDGDIGHDFSVRQRRSSIAVSRGEGGVI